MTKYARKILAHGAWTLTLLFLALSVVMGLVFDRFPLLEAAAGIAVGLFSVMGAVIVLRHPSNPVGWIFCGLGTVFGISSLLNMYAVARPLLPGAEWAAWGATWTWLVAIGLLVQVLLLYPDGRYPSSRWRWVGLVGIVGAATVAIGSALTPGVFPDYAIENPAGVDWVEGSVIESGGIGWAGVLAGLLGGAASLVVRFRRSEGIVRAQLKWFVFASSLFGVSAVLSAVFLREQEAGKPVSPSVMATVSVAIFVVALSAIPVAAAIAILRYRLYDIDLIINRTLVYGALTAVLALVYVGGVVGLGGLIRQATGQQDNSLVIAATTLLVAGLVRPLRSRIQEFIDRRFYRRRYDAARTVEAFSTRLRDEVDLDAMRLDLLTVVQETMQPARASLWLRG